MRLNAYELDIEFFALQLRKHAAAHQTGMCLQEAKHHVDLTLQQMKEVLGKDKVFQVLKWNELLAMLDKFNSNTQDPMWRTVINHARFRVKSRRSTIIHARRRFKD
ncbi:hypothetical protein ACCY16_07130 [Candidatus Pantoea formicae]|uniref:hypothetical protein n=1 Tax=Candidatus Pantoea formicae TaxID=2608355 RepID=UPI003ED8738E